MVFLRHINGNGRKYDESEACSATELRRSALYGETQVFDSLVRDSNITDSFVSGALIVGSEIAATIIAGRAQIVGSILSCRSVAGRAKIVNSVITGESTIAGRARVTNSNFQNLHVSGDAELSDWNFRHFSFEGQFGRITTGSWSRPPRIVRFEDLEITVTEGVRGRAFVGCIEKPIATWLKCGARFGAARGWTPEQVDRLVEIFKDWSR